MKKSRKAGKKQENVMVAKIQKADNGIILEVSAFGDTPQVMVYQDREGDEVECFADFLRLLNEHFGPATSRYSEKRIYIRVESGDKFEKRI